MWTIFIFIGILLLFVIFLGIAFIISLLSNLFGGLSNLWYLITGKKVGSNKKRAAYNNSSNSNYSNSSSANSSNSGQTHSHKREKVFTADEGEYVNFEEIKD